MRVLFCRQMKNFTLHQQCLTPGRCPGASCCFVKQTNAYLQAATARAKDSALLAMVFSDTQNARRK